MEHQVHVGDIVDVTITGIQPYGAFALLPDGSSGLIVETPKGFNPLREMMPRWISRGIAKEEDV